jgi:hypothetical protein
MRRGNYQSGQECSTSSSWMTGLMSLAGGIGIGAGLLYLLDPETGEKRRRNIVSGARHLGENLAGTASDWLSSAGDYAGDTAKSARKSTRRFARDRADEASGMVSSVRDFVGDKLSGVSDYASEKYEGAKGYLQDRLGRETRAEHRISVSICALSSMALGAALMYVFDPTMGRSRRRAAMDTASDMASRAGDYASQAGGYVKDQASHLASQAGDMMNQAKDKVSGMASGMTGSSGDTTSGASCPPGMMPASQATTNASLNAGTRTTF